MITIHNKEFRNWIEQIAKNSEDIQDLLRGNATLAEFGLKIVFVSEDGTAPVDPPIPEAGDTTTFGYSWLVRDISQDILTYSIYVWTRNDFGADALWVDLGEFPKPGPQGLTGPVGQTGLTGRTPRVYSYLMNGGALKPNVNVGLDGDMFLDSNGDFLTKESGIWVIAGNLTGPRGLQGVKGDTGAQGPQGYTPNIGANGNWFINGVDTGSSSIGIEGPQGPQGINGTGETLHVHDGIYSTANPLPAFSATAEGDAYVFLDSTGLYDLYFHGVGGSDWTIIDDWSGVASGDTLPIINCTINMPAIGVGATAFTFPDGFPNYKSGSYENGSMSVLLRLNAGTFLDPLIPSTSTMPTYAVIYSVDYSVTINNAATLATLTNAVYAKQNMLVPATLFNPPTDSSRRLEVNLPRYPQNVEPVNPNPGKASIPYYNALVTNRQELIAELTDVGKSLRVADNGSGSVTFRWEVAGLTAAQVQAMIDASVSDTLITGG